MVITTKKLAGFLDLIEAELRASGMPLWLAVKRDSARSPEFGIKLGMTPGPADLDGLTEENFREKLSARLETFKNAITTIQATLAPVCPKVAEVVAADDSPKLSTGMSQEQFREAIKDNAPGAKYLICAEDGIRFRTNDVYELVEFMQVQKILNKEHLYIGQPSY